MLLLLLRILLRLALVVLLGYLLYRFYLALRHAFRQSESQQSEKRKQAAMMVLDPECGNYIHENDALHADIAGKRHHFCSRECRDAYLRKIQP